MNILITGACGFIGNNLFARLYHEGHHLTPFDIADNPNNDVKLFHNLCEVAAASEKDVGRPIDQIYHLACHASPAKYSHDPIDTLQTCVVGTDHVLNWAAVKKIPVLFTSTSEVYGDPLPTEHPQLEYHRGRVNTMGWRSCYDEGKRAAEAMCWAWWKRSGVDVRIARIFNTYGPGMSLKDGRMLPNFIHCASEGLPLPIYGDGKQTRSWCYVDDTVDALIRMMNHERTDDEKHGPPLIYNVGNPDERTVESVAKMVLEHYPEAPQTLQYLEGLNDDPLRRCPDISKITRDLGWSPKTGFVEGLAETIAYYR